MILLIPIIYRLVIDYKLCVTLDFSEVVQIYFTKPVRLKFGLIRVVAFGWCDLIREGGHWLEWPYKSETCKIYIFYLHYTAYYFSKPKQATNICCSVTIPLIFLGEGKKQTCRCLNYHEGKTKLKYFVLGERSRSTSN